MARESRQQSLFDGREIKLTAMRCLPDSLIARKYYEPGVQGHEARVKERMEQIENWRKSHENGGK